MNVSNRSRLFAGAGALLIAGATAHAVPQTVQAVDTTHCDFLPLPAVAVVDELGLPPVFPTDERIQADSTFTNQPACPEDNPNVPNALVVMTNLTPFSFVETYYVADPPLAGIGGTTISNEDGLVNFGQAFKIDAVGINKPLIFESIAFDGIFQAGETWRFIIDDYRNSLGLPAFAFNSIGVGFASPGGPSSGSIIGIVPEPSSLGAAALVGAILLGRSRRQ